MVNFFLYSYSPRLRPISRDEITSGLMLSLSSLGATPHSPQVRLAASSTVFAVSLSLEAWLRSMASLGNDALRESRFPRDHGYV